MKNLKLKICGMRDPENILEVAAMRPDFMGFIFYSQSKRFVGNDFSIPKEIPQEIQRVGVFVNESVEEILRMVEKHRLDFVQLHGDESVQVCEALKKETKLIKVFRVGEHFDLNQTKEFEGLADFFMFDTKTSGFGGSGKSFDWNLLETYVGSTLFFLSGGLSPNNIEQVRELKNGNFFAVDVNSGAETSPGVKSLPKLNSLFDILHSKFLST